MAAAGSVGLPPLDKSSRPLPPSAAEAQPPLTGIIYMSLAILCVQEHSPHTHILSHCVYVYTSFHQQVLCTMIL